MSYALSAALQEAVYQHLRADPGVTAALGTAIHDALPEGPVPGLYLAIGAEEVREWSDKTGGGARHDLTLSVVTDAGGFAEAKAAAAAVSAALEDAWPAMAEGRIVALQFRRARAQREADGRRRIDLIFRALVDED